MDRFRVRRAVIGDLDVVMAILDSAAARHGRSQWSREHVERGLTRDVTLLGHVDREAVATVTLQAFDPDVWGEDAARAPDAMYVHRLASSKPGAGLGAAMLAAAEEWAASESALVVRLDCGVGDSRLRRFYIDLGYLEIAVVERPRWRLVLLEKRLTV